MSKKQQTPQEEEQPAAVAAVEPEKRSHEQWAEAKGYLPQFSVALEPLPYSSGRVPNPNYWKYEATKVPKKWEPGQLMTEQQFDAAVSEMLSRPI